MIKTLWVAIVAMILVLGLAACGGGGDAGSDGSTATTNADGSQGDMAATPGTEADAQETPDMPSEGAGSYRTQNDPNAVYTLDDVTMEGSYLKIDFQDLTPDQLNRVLHRLRTEVCTCGCPDDPIDQCLVNDPACGTAVTLATQIIREEKMKG